MPKKLTTEEFIRKSKGIHGDKFDYSLVKYENSKTKVKIICNDCGYEFNREPHFHLKKNVNNGCKRCYTNSNYLNTEKFIYKSKKIHGCKYDYSLVDYKGTNKKVNIICKKHGIFKQIPNSHLSGHGCSRCAVDSISVADFVKKSNKIHNNKYDYSLVSFRKTVDCVKIICPKHGVFKQRVSNHLHGGSGCKICGISNRKMTIDEFIDKSKDVHGDKYDYSLVKYIDAKTKVKVICPKHGVFHTVPFNHINGRMCSICSNENRFYTTEEFISKSKDVHGDKYDYSLVEYKNSSSKVKIICPNHGIFEQKPIVHLSNHGCPICNESKGEKKISKFLKMKKIKYEREKIFKDCKNISYLRFDFYLPKYNMCIEFDGIQHFYPSPYYGHYRLIDVKMNDKIKNKYCEDNNIKILRIRYDQYSEIENIMNDFILEF